jgi:hypothetical protein
MSATMLLWRMGKPLECIPLLIEAIKEQQKQINGLQSRIIIFKNKNNLDYYNMNNYIMK